MLWIAIYLPDLCLQLAMRGTEKIGALIISDNAIHRPSVVAVNFLAVGAGIKTGMPVAAAEALVDNLTIVSRQPTIENEALSQLACWASQFTPNLSIQFGEGLLLEVRSTMRIFGGLRALHTKITNGIQNLGYHGCIAIAPTPIGAWLIAKAKHYDIRAKSCMTLEKLHLTLGPLPLILFSWPMDALKKLHALAIITVDDFIALPRDGITQRFGNALLIDIDKALGYRPDPRSYFSTPENYNGRVEFLAEVIHIDALLFPLQRLLAELEGFLRARGAGVQTLSLLIQHAHQEKTAIICRTATIERHAELFHRLFKEQLQRTVLSMPAIGIVLSTTTLLPLTLQSQSWLPDKKNEAIHSLHLEDRLIARLGKEQVIKINVDDDHRPEKAWLNTSQETNTQSSFPLRPVWLLPLPKQLLTQKDQPFFRGALEILAGPERLESGWWDTDTISRDYFVACNSHGENFWIFREHAMPHHWYLHGIFS